MEGRGAHWPAHASDPASHEAGWDPLSRGGVPDLCLVQGQRDPTSSRRSVLAEGWDQLSRRVRSEEHTSELQSQSNLVCRLLLEKKKKKTKDKETQPDIS